MDWVWWLLTNIVIYLVIGSVLSSMLITIFPKSAPAMATLFLWCSIAHKSWHVVAHERPTLTRFYCTRCGFEHIKMKRRKDHGKPTKLPE